MDTLNGVVVLFGVMLLALYLLAVLPSFKRHTKRIVCPVRHEPRMVVFQGRSLDGESWERVGVCTPEGQPLFGPVTCSMLCLLDPANGPRRDLPR